MRAFGIWPKTSQCVSLVNHKFEDRLLSCLHLMGELSSLGPVTWFSILISDWLLTTWEVIEELYMGTFAQQDCQSSMCLYSMISANSSGLDVGMVGVPVLQRELHKVVCCTPVRPQGNGDEMFSIFHWSVTKWDPKLARISNFHIWLLVACDGLKLNVSCFCFKKMGAASGDPPCKLCLSTKL